MNVCHSLVTTARLLADHPAIIFEDQTFNYGQLDARSRRAARVLKECGVERGDRVGLVIPNVPAFAVWYYAALRTGAIAVAVNTVARQSLVNDLHFRPEAGSIVTNLVDCVEALKLQLHVLTNRLLELKAHAEAVETVSG